MVNLFRKNEPIKPGSYKYIFYPDEFQQPGGKTKEFLYLHVITQTGEIRVYLLKELRTETKWGNIPQPQQTKIKKFIQENRQFIMLKIEKELNKLSWEQEKTLSKKQIFTFKDNSRSQTSLIAK